MCERESDLLHGVQAVESEKKNGTGQGKLFGLFHISAFDLADATGQVQAGSAGRKECSRQCQQ